MSGVAWMLGVIIVGGVGYMSWRAHGQWQDRQRASEARMASFVAQMKGPAAQPAPQPSPQPSGQPRPAAQASAGQPAAQEQLLFEAAAKSAQAGEPVLAIRLYARLLSRYPQSALAAQARAAVAEQKTRLAKT